MLIVLLRETGQHIFPTIAPNKQSKLDLTTISASSKLDTLIQRLYRHHASCSDTAPGSSFVQKDARVGGIGA
jgi:hypothetical protein